MATSDHSSMTPLYPHQQRIIDALPTRKILAWATSLGKTRALIELAKKAHSTPLIICPKSIKARWTRDFPTATVVTKEEFRRDWSKLPWFDAVIVDEVHAFSGFSLMSKALQAYLKKRRPSFVWGASATPWRSTPWNVYNLAKIMGAEWGYTKFRDSFFRTQYFGTRCVWVPKEDDATRTRLVNALSKFCDIVSAEEAGMPPEDVFEEELFTLTAEQKKAIKDIALTESNPVVRYGKEHQIAQGHLKGTEFEASRTYKNEKTDRILELAQEHPSMVIFARYTGQIELIADALKKKGHTVFTMTGTTKDRDKLIQDVENAKECILIVQTALGEGFEVPRFDFAIFASLPFSYVEFAQCIGRASRVNVPKRRTYVTFTVEGSIDEAVRDALHNKRDFIIELYDK